MNGPKRDNMVFLLVAVLVVSFSATPAVYATDQQMLQGELSRLIPRWTEAMDALGVPGMVVGIVGPEGPLYVGELGRRNIESDLPVDSDTYFYIASMTKPFVALAVGLLAEERLIDLDSPVRVYLPRFVLADPIETETITVRDLLAHRKGLGSHPITFGEAYTGQMDDDRFYRLLSQVRGVGELDYNNLHYTLLGRIIEAVTDQSWKDYVEREVLRPAGMDRSALRIDPLTDDPNAAIPYTRVDGSFQRARLKTNRTMHAAGGMVSTLGDLMRWLQIHLAKGRLDGTAVFPPDLIREMQILQIYELDQNPVVPEDRRIGWGLGWDVHADRHGIFYAHSGTYKGWTAYMSFMPESRIGLVVLANSDGAQWLSVLLSLELYDSILVPEQPRVLIQKLVSLAKSRAESIAAEPRREQEQGAGPSRSLETYIGVYENEDWGTIEISASSEGMVARMGDLPLPLVWIGVDSFIADEDHDGHFEIDDSGRVVAVHLGELLPRPDFVEFERKQTHR